MLSISAPANSGCSLMSPLSWLVPAANVPFSIQVPPFFTGFRNLKFFIVLIFSMPNVSFIVFEKNKTIKERGRDKKKKIGKEKKMGRIF